MSKENLEQFMKQVADSKDLQAKIGEEITGIDMLSFTRMEFTGLKHCSKRLNLIARHRGRSTTHLESVIFGRVVASGYHYTRIQIEVV